MNLVVVDHVSKSYHPYIDVIHEIEMFICKNIIAINRKYNSFLVVQTDIDTKIFQDQGYTMNQALFDSLVMKYNNELVPGEERLELWIRT